MHQFSKNISLLILSFALVACGGGSSSTGETDSSEPTNNSNTTQNTSTESNSSLLPSSLPIALDHTGHAVQKSFNDYNIKVLSNKTLTGQEEISYETIAVYGSVNQQETKALLKINANYRDSLITLEIYKDSELLARKESLSLTNQIALNFGNITVE